jgi:hypothetical protein
MAIVLMAVSFIPENFHEFFGDWKCQGSGNWIENGNGFQRCNYGGCGKHDSLWHYGFRHWILILFGFISCIVNVFRVVDLFGKK